MKRSARTWMERLGWATVVIAGHVVVASCTMFNGDLVTAGGVAAGLAVGALGAAVLSKYSDSLLMERYRRLGDLELAALGAGDVGRIRGQVAAIEESFPVAGFDAPVVGYWVGIRETRRYRSNGQKRKVAHIAWKTQQWSRFAVKADQGLVELEIKDVTLFVMNERQVLLQRTGERELTLDMKLEHDASPTRIGQVVVTVPVSADHELMRRAASDGFKPRIDPEFSYDALIIAIPVDTQIELIGRVVRAEQRDGQGAYRSAQSARFTMARMDDDELIMRVIDSKSES